MVWWSSFSELVQCRTHSLTRPSHCTRSRSLDSPGWLQMLSLYSLWEVRIDDLLEHACLVSDLTLSRRHRRWPRFIGHVWTTRLVPCLDLLNCSSMCGWASWLGRVARSSQLHSFRCSVAATSRDSGSERSRSARRGAWSGCLWHCGNRRFDFATHDVRLCKHSIASTIGLICTVSCSGVSPGSRRWQSCVLLRIAHQQSVETNHTISTRSTSRFDHLSKHSPPQLFSTGRLFLDSAAVFLGLESETPSRPFAASNVPKPNAENAPLHTIREPAPAYMPRQPCSFMM